MTPPEHAPVTSRPRGREPVGEPSSDPPARRGNEGRAAGVWPGTVAGPEVDPARCVFILHRRWYCWRPRCATARGAREATRLCFSRLALSPRHVRTGRAASRSGLARARRCEMRLCPGRALGRARERGSSGGCRVPLRESFARHARCRSERLRARSRGPPPPHSTPPSSRSALFPAPPPFPTPSWRESARMALAEPAQRRADGCRRPAGLAASRRSDATLTVRVHRLCIPPAVTFRARETQEPEPIRRRRSVASEPRGRGARSRGGEPRGRRRRWRERR